MSQSKLKNRVGNTAAVGMVGNTALGVKVGNSTRDDGVLCFVLDLFLVCVCVVGVVYIRVSMQFVQWYLSLFSILV